MCCLLRDLDRHHSKRLIVGLRPRESKRSLFRTTDECLDDDGNVVYGKKKVIDGWEKKYGLQFMHNCLFDMADDVGLHPVVGPPRDLFALDYSRPVWVSHYESYNLFDIPDYPGCCVYD